VDHLAHLARAEQTAAGIREKLVAARERLEVLGNERIGLALPAQAGDASARKRLEAVQAEKLRQTAEIETLEIALAQAGQAVAAAERAVQVAEDCAKARQAIALVAEFEARGAALSQSLAAFVKHYAKLTADFHELDAIGYAPTTYPAIASAMQAATATALMFTDLGQNFLAPHQRKDFAAVIAGWAWPVRHRAEATLQRHEKEAA